MFMSQAAVSAARALCTISVLVYRRARFVMSSHLCSHLQVYLGSLHETTVAIKILLGSTMVNSEAEAEEALEASRKASAAVKQSACAAGTFCLCRRAGNRWKERYPQTLAPTLPAAFPSTYKMHARVFNSWLLSCW